MQHTILVVDDERDIVDSIERQFRKKYHVIKSTSALEALKILDQEPVHLIISDQRMPEMTGVQLFEQVRKSKPDIIRILLTGYTDVESVIAAINAGEIYRYITKPWDPHDLEVIVRRALDAYDLQVELKEKNIRLEKALEELKTLDQAKSHFMILIGHELKTPLTTASSFLDLLREEKLPADAAKYVQRVGQGVDRLREIVFDVLDIMNAENAQTKLKKSVLNINDAAAMVIGEFVDQISKKALKLEVTDKKIKAYFDTDVITKVLRKIVHNAIKFAEEDSEIKITFSEKPDGVQVAVANSGPAIPPEKISAILKPFTLDEDIMHHHQGLGLGLSVCQSLLKHHGTRLEIVSGKNTTTVGFLLPKPS